MTDKDILFCRQVCKRWSVEVDKFLEIQDNVEDEEFVKRLKFPLDEQQKDNLTAMENHTRNPLVCGRLYFEIWNACTVEIKDQILDVLNRFGKHVRKLNCDFMPNHENVSADDENILGLEIISKCTYLKCSYTNVAMYICLMLSENQATHIYNMLQISNTSIHIVILRMEDLQVLASFDFLIFNLEKLVVYMKWGHLDTRKAVEEHGIVIMLIDSLANRTDTVYKSNVWQKCKRLNQIMVKRWGPRKLVYTRERYELFCNARNI